MSERVVVNDNKAIEHDTQRAVLEDAGVEVVAGNADDERELRALLDGAAGVVTDAGTRFTRAVFEAPETDDLRVVGRSGIGVDNIDVAAAADAGVTVVHVPDYCLDEVSTHAFALLLACVRNVGVFDRQTAGGGWDWTAGRPIHRTAGGTLGLVAFGDIAKRVAEKASGFGFDVIAYDPYLDDAAFEEYGVERVEFEELLERSEYVSVHAPLTPETRGLFDADAFARMREGSILVNTARGGLVDEAALLDALDDGTLARAGLDVMAEEPPENSPLPGRDDVIVTSHVAWYSEESREELSRKVAEDVRRVLDGDPPRSPVDPEEGW